VPKKIKLVLAPSIAVGALAALPWLTLTVFLIIAGAAGKYWLIVILPVTLTGALVQYRHKGLLNAGTSVMALVVEDNQCSAQLADGRVIPVHVSTDSRMGAKLALLKLRPQGTRLLFCSTILLADITSIPGNVAEDDFRRLRVWLRLGRSQPTPA
jgi:toxin CptA